MKPIGPKFNAPIARRRAFSFRGRSATSGLRGSPANSTPQEQGALPIWIIIYANPQCGATQPPSGMVLWAARAARHHFRHGQPVAEGRPDAGCASFDGRQKIPWPR